MSLEIEEPLLPDHPEAIQESKRKAKISYSRDFLLSLSELDVCKKLPSGFDESALSDFNDASHNVQDRQRISGNYPLQGFRRNEYGSSPPTRGDLSNHSRGIQGKWDSRPPGRTGSDSDSQSERDSDSGRHGDQSRRSWQNPEQHDGLLGSGSYPRPSGYAAGLSAPKFGANDQHQINKSTEPYQPPRPYKAIPHLRKDTKDSYNAETFGSFECTSQDRAEEERKRRAAFELMRKEQKELQEKQKLNLDQHKERPLSDVSALQEDPKENNKFESVIESYPHNVSGKTSFYSQAPASRPLVPPGFASTGPEKNLGIKPLTHSPPEGEVRNLPLDDSWLHAKDSTALNRVSVNQKENQSALKMGFGGQQFETVQVQHDDKGEKNLNLLSVLDVSNELIRMDETTPYTTSSALQPVKAVDRNIIKLSNEKFMGLGNKVDTVQDQSKTILEKLFDTALTINNGGSPRKIEPRDSKDGLWSSDTNQSSKFAPLFLQEEKRPVDGYSSGRSSDLLSIIVGGSKDGPRVSEMKSTEQILPGCPFDNSGIKNDQMKSNMLSSTVEISDQLCSNNISDKIPPVLTCEDLEQSILSGINENSSDLSVQGCSLLPQKTNQPTRSASDDHASQHLLSLLQKGAGLQEIVPTPNHDMLLSERQLVLEAGYSGTTAPNNSKMENAEKVHDSGSALTLETLFGSAFMKELQDSVGSARIDVSEPHAPASSVVDGVHFPRTANGIVSSRSTCEGTLNNKQETKLGNTEGHWLPDDPQQQMNSMNIPTEVGAKPGGFDAEVEFHLPEEESLLTGSDPAGSSFISPMNATKPLLSSFPNMPVEIAENLIALDARIRDERPLRGALDGPPFWHNPHNLMESEIPHQNLHPQPSQLMNPQVNHGRPLLHPLLSHAAHINPQMKFMPQGSSIPHNVPPAHQLHGNMLGSQIQHPKTALSSFDHANYHPLLQKMHMLDNFPPPHSPHLLPGFSRGAALPSQPNNRQTGFTQDANMMNNFQFGHQNPNLGNTPMPMPAPDVAGRSSHPVTLERLFNMEFRSNSNQMSPFSIADHAQGLQGDGLDIGFRYR